MVKTTTLNVDQLVNLFLDSLPFDIDQVERIEQNGIETAIHVKDGRKFKFSSLAWVNATPAEIIEINGWTIRYNALWDTFQCSWEGVLMEECASLGEAVNLCNYSKC